ncbi:MAG: 2-amino-4-hydroxy-6-hydroxymethyldihydropteridine diphosphokinase [Beijerinckiaceae bacterium]
MGDVAGAFVTALAALEVRSDCSVVARSSVWRTPPWGKTDQPDFLNMCALIDTTLKPHELLDVCLALEFAAGRVRFERWGPRVLDIDLLAYGDLSVSDERLVVPHPRMFERAFVLAPLAEIAPDLRIGNDDVASLARACDASGLRVDEDASARVHA